MASSRALCTPEILLLMIADIDASALLALRLTNSHINSIIVTHQKFIFNSIASREYSINIDLTTSGIPHVAGIFYLKALVRLPKARFLAVRAVEKGSYFSPMMQGIPANNHMGDAIRARGTRGIIILWALVDIQQSVKPSGPIPRYSPISAVDSLVPAPSRRRRSIARLFRTHASRMLSMMTPTNTPPTASTSGIHSEYILPPSHYIASTPASASEAKERIQMIYAAQRPFVASADRDTRVDMELARILLNWLSPFDFGGYCFGGPSLEYTRKCRWQENWALRKGPGFIYAICSSDSNERDWAMARMDAEWSIRKEDVVEVESIMPMFAFRDTEDQPMLGSTFTDEAWQLRQKAVNAYIDMEYPNS